MSKKITLDELNLLADGTPPHLVREKWKTCADILPILAHIAAMAEIVSRYKQDKWISVDDRLPDTRDIVLICVSDIPGGYVTTGWMLGDKFERRNVTHWMPLPEPPESEG